MVDHITPDAAIYSATEIDVCFGSFAAEPSGPSADLCRLLLQ
jgi:hypothetical protein